jgi:hypothetical protein
VSKQQQEYNAQVERNKWQSGADRVADQNGTKIGNRTGGELDPTNPDFNRHHREMQNRKNNAGDSSIPTCFVSLESDVPKDNKNLDPKTKKNILDAIATTGDPASTKKQKEGAIEAVRLELRKDPKKRDAQLDVIARALGDDDFNTRKGAKEVLSRLAKDPKLQEKMIASLFSEGDKIGGKNGMDLDYAKHLKDIGKLMAPKEDEREFKDRRGRVRLHVDEGAGIGLINYDDKGKLSYGETMYGKSVIRLADGSYRLKETDNLGHTKSRNYAAKDVTTTDKGSISLADRNGWTLLRAVTTDRYNKNGEIDFTVPERGRITDGPELDRFDKVIPMKKPDA